MALDRFTNITEIRDTPGLVRGIPWPQNSIEQLDLDEVRVRPTEKPIVEVHIYTPTNESYLGGGPTTEFVIQDDKIYIDYVKVFATLNIKRGFFKVAVNIYYEIIGSYTYPLLKVNDISADNREVVLSIFQPRAVATTSSDAIDKFLTLYPKALEHDFALNFGENVITRLINYKPYPDNNVLAVRTLTQLPLTIKELTRCNIIELVSDTWIDNISLDQLAPAPNLIVLRGPNFNIESGYTTVTDTDFKNWNDLLGSNVSVSQKIINSMFSGSLSGVDLGIDYTAFTDFVYYSSAVARIEGFRSKLELIEYYDDRLHQLNNTSGSSSGSVNVNKTSVISKRDDVIGQFDSFEQWLYNEPTSSIYTHGVSGSLLKYGIEGERFAITPYPKYISGSQYVVHSVTSSISETWYDAHVDAAVIFDAHNPYSLVRSIPLHIREDANNSEYDTFVNMVAHHFDILYTYTNALTRVHLKEEHPKRGIDKDVLVDVAKSFGWQLTNGYQASQLWQYVLGTNSSGGYAQTGSIFSQADADITGEIWRRIVNNLPYILKSRGTQRSVDALMNIYGIPRSILSVREYGGPAVANDFPALTDDRYSYAIFLNSGSYITYDTCHISSSIGNWGIPRGTTNVVAPQTREFRFRPAITGSMLLYSQLSATNQPLTHIAIHHTGSYSGSGMYGKIAISFGKGTANTTPISASTDWLPLFNGDFWNLRYSWETSGDHFNTGSNDNTTYSIEVQQASDFIRGKINVSSSIIFTPTHVNHFNVWSTSSIQANRNSVFIGGNTGSTDTFNVNSSLASLIGAMPGTYSGSMQEYREWLEYIDGTAFDDHTLNPTSYVSYLSPSSSYDTLVRHYMLGTNIVGVDLSSPGTIISSSHPNQYIKDFGVSSGDGSNARAYGFNVAADLQRGNFVPVDETYYVRGVSLGMNSPRSEKIRIEDNYLIRRLSPIASAERSSFDNAPLDSNKLGLFYSFADQVNSDIYNHVGGIELDDYVGDPDDEYEVVYEDLKHFATQYWKKFTNTSDTNSYNRIFSQFDFSVFNQIKQTLPIRIDDVSGLLIEPNALERSKVQITKPIKVENPQYDFNLARIPTLVDSDSITEYEALIDNSETAFYTPAASYYEDYVGETSILKHSGSSDYHTIETLPVDELRSYTASFIASNYYVSASIGVVKSYSNNQAVLFNPTSTVTPKNWSDTTSPLTQYEWIQQIVSSNTNAQLPITALASGDSTAQIRLKLDSFTNDMLIRPKIQLRVDVSSFSTSTTIEYTTALVHTELDDVHSRIMTVYDVKTGTVTDDSLFDVQFDSVLIPHDVRLTLIIQFNVPTSPATSGGVLTLKSIIPIITIEKVCHSVRATEIYNPRTSDIFMKHVYHYSGSNSLSSKTAINFSHAQSASNGIYYSRSLAPASYRDEFIESYERAFYIGTQLTAPKINVSSNETAIGNTPVVEVFEVNPNQIFYTTTPAQPGNGSNLEPGNISIR